MKRVTNVLLLTFLMALSSIAIAQNKVVLIPMAGDHVEPLANVVTVAKQNGDFEDPVAAMASIVDADESNPYLLVIAPGVYELGSQQLFMKEYVEIAGSGQNATFLRGTVSGGSLDSNAAMVVGADNSSLRDLTIQNVDGNSSYSIGIYNNTTFRVLDVTIAVSGGSGSQLGLRSVSGAHLTLQGCTINVSGSGNQRGIWNTSSELIVIDSKITVSSGNTQWGLFNDGAASASFTESVITVSGGSNDQYGVQNLTLSFSTITRSTIAISGGSSDQYGIYNNDTGGGVAIVKNSVVSAPTNSVYAGDGTGSYESYISDSFLSSAIDGDLKCSFTFLTDGTELDSNCDTGE
jgi:hypothetical protein